MARDPEKVSVYHITDIENLPGILAEEGLHSDAAMAKRVAAVIGYEHIKARRLGIRIPCCSNRFVGEFVPFYYCPRSPMLYTINRGNTGRAEGCQRSILHLVSTVAAGLELGGEWAVSDGNASTAYASFGADTRALSNLDWSAIEARDWRGKTFQKAAEFLVADFFPWTAVRRIGCHNKEIAEKVKKLLVGQSHLPVVSVEPEWYY